MRWRQASQGSGRTSSGIVTSGCSTFLGCCKDDGNDQIWITLHLNCIRYQHFHRRFHSLTRLPLSHFKGWPSRLNFLWWSCPGLCRRLVLSHYMLLCRIYELLTTSLTICWLKVWQLCSSQDQRHHLWSKQKYAHVLNGVLPRSKVCLHSLLRIWFRILHRQLQVDQQPLLLVWNSQLQLATQTWFHEPRLLLPITSK